MAQEIERKFLVKGDDWKNFSVSKMDIVQGYLSTDPMLVVRVRIIEGSKGFLTIKSKGTGISRPEYEYEIPYGDAAEMMELCGDRKIEKTRHIVPAENERVWEVDVFKGAHEGLTVAEIELGTEDEAITRPYWIGKEVTGNRLYNNAVMASYGSVSAILR